MLQQEREELIEYIKVNDSTYDYNVFNFKYYTDKDLLELKKRVEMQMQNKSKPTAEDGGLQPSVMT